MSDTFYAGGLWYVLGGLLLIMATARWWVAVLTGLAIAIFWNTREEGLLLVAIVFAWWAIFFMSEKRRQPSKIVAFRTTARTLIVVCLCAIVGIIGFYSRNYAVFHSFARSEMTARTFQSLYHSLLRIRPAEPKRYAPITTAALSEAFRVSPTFAKLRPELEGPIGESWRTESHMRVGITNEIGAGWIVWATRQAASARGYFATPERARYFFKKASHEINRACDEGRVPTRFVIDGFLDPLVQSGGVENLPHSARRVLARFFARWSIRSITDDQILTPDETALYDQMTLRRSPGVGPRRGAAFFFENFLARYYFIASVALHVAAAAAIGWLFYSKRKAESSARFADAILLLGCAVFFRTCLFIWLDATAFDGTEDRFLFPILPLWTVVLTLLAGWAFEARAATRPATENS